MSNNNINLDRRALLAALIGGPIALGSSALAEDGGGRDVQSVLADASVQLQAIGGLGVGQITSTIGLVGALADIVSKENYTQKRLEDVLNETITGLDSPKKLLRRLQDANISDSDAEFLDKMIGVYNALQRESRDLITYVKSNKPEDAQRFENSRQTVLRKLADLTQQDNILPNGGNP
jgi:hypothetical protein